MRVTRVALLVLVLATGAARAQSSAPASEPGPAIGDGSVVSLEYTMSDDGGTVLDSNTGRTPFTYTQGQQQIVPGLEQALVGMHVGEEKEVTVSPDEAYGPVDPTAEAEVPKEAVPADALAVGTRLIARSPEGDTRVVRVKEVRESTVLIDLNHPLAGVTLHFAVRILRVEPPAPQPSE